MQLMMQKRRQSSYNSNSNEQQQQLPHDRITPLPYNTVPIIHHNNKSLLRSSFTKHLQQSSFLFPELKKKNSMMNSSSDNSCSLSTTNKSVATNSSDTKIPQPAQLVTATAATCSSMTSSINSTTCTPQNCNDKKKKSVHFNKDLQINYPPNNKLYHNNEDQSSNALLWYTPQDYNKFKFQAAKSAGVKLINMVPSQDNDISNSMQRNEFKERRRQLQSSIFVMVGNFDTKLKKENEDTNIINTAAADAISSESSSRSTDTIIPTIDNNAKKRDNTKKRKTMSYHNENEYNDQHAAIIVDMDSNNKEEEEEEEEVTVCKRGLGYHFSTSRKRTRHTSRLAVLAWQKALQQSENKNDESSSKKAVVSSVAVSAAAANTVAGGGVTNNKVSSRALLTVAEAAAVSVSAANSKSNTNSSANDDNNDSNSKSSTQLQNDKQLLTLSIISSKCSRTSRHEAIWRGDVDYRIAYPERFADANGHGQSFVHNGNQQQQQQSVATKIHGHGTRNVVHGEASNNMSSNDKKRSVGNDGTTRIKRRKVTTDVYDGSNNIVPLSCPNESIDEALSPETIGYLVKGILHADV